MTSEKVMKNEAPKRVDLDPGVASGGGDLGENPYGCGKTHIFAKSEHITWEWHTNGPG